MSADAEPSGPQPAADRWLWLVRHGETAGQSSIRYHGRNDVPLSDAGRQQIRALAPLLAGVTFARIVHSPLVRAVESAAILRDELGMTTVPMAADDRLREIDFGSCEGMTRDEIAAAYPTFFDDYAAGRVDAFPGGESRTACRERIGAAMRELARSHASGDLLVVGHRGTVRYALVALLGLDADVPAAFGVELASLTTLRFGDGRWQLELLGMRP